MKRMAPLFVIAAGVLWGIIGLFTRLLSTAGFNAVQITTTRCTITAISLTMYLLIADKEKLKIHIKDVWIFLGTGICSIVFFNICYFKALQLVTLSLAAILLYTAPCFVMIMSAIFFHEHITKQKTVAFILAFIGCFLTTGLIGSGSFQISIQGIFYGLASGFGYALYSIFGRIALKKYHSFTVTVYTFIVASISLLPVSHMSSLILQMNQQPSMISRIVVYAILLGLLSTLLPFLLYTKGLEHMEAGKASVMAFVEPMVATLIGIIVFKEGMTLQNILGIILIFGSVILLNIQISKVNYNFKIKLPSTDK